MKQVYSSEQLNLTYVSWECDHEGLQHEREKKNLFHTLLLSLILIVLFFTPQSVTSYSSLHHLCLSLF